MSNPTSSLFPVPAERAFEAARKAIRFANDQKKKAWEEAVANAMKPRRVWFRLRARTRAEAESYLQETEDTGLGFRVPCPHAFREPDQWARMWGKDLSAAVAATEGPTVYLNQQDARLVHRFA